MRQTLRGRRAFERQSADQQLRRHNICHALCQNEMRVVAIQLFSYMGVSTGLVVTGDTAI